MEHLRRNQEYRPLSPETPMGDSTVSLGTLAGVQYDPPEREPDPWDGTPVRRWPALLRWIECCTPLGVREVEGKSRRAALLVYHLLLLLFVVYCIKSITQSLNARKKPPTSFNIIRENWDMPNMVMCDPRMDSMYYAMHLGWSRGYPQTDDNANQTRKAFRRRVTVLDSACPGSEGCVFMELKGMRPDGTMPPMKQAKLSVGLVYLPIWDPTTHNESLPDNYEANVMLTDSTMEEWCAAGSQTHHTQTSAHTSQTSSAASGAPQGMFPAAVSNLSNMTVMNLVTLKLRHTHDLRVTDSSALHTEAVDHNYYDAVTAVLEVNNDANKTVKYMTMFTTCNQSSSSSDTHTPVCGTDKDYNDVYARVVSPETNRVLPGTHAFILTIVQDDYVTHIDQVDPVSISDFFANAGGFWSYVAGVFSLLYALNEADRRRPLVLLRKKTWTKFCGAIDRWFRSCLAPSSRWCCRKPKRRSSSDGQSPSVDTAHLDDTHTRTHTDRDTGDAAAHADVIIDVDGRRERSGRSAGSGWGRVRELIRGGQLQTKPNQYATVEERVELLEDVIMAVLEAPILWSADQSEGSMLSAAHHELRGSLSYHPRASSPSDDDDDVDDDDDESSDTHRRSNGHDTDRDYHRRRRRARGLRQSNTM